MSDYPIDLPVRLQIAQSLLGPVDAKGYCRCPGAESHSNKSGPSRPDRPGRDCRVYLDRSERNPRGVPTVRCVHTSCQGTVVEMNHRLRREIARHESSKARQEGYVFTPPAKRRRSREEIEAQKAGRIKLALSVRARNSLKMIVRDWPWDRADMWEAGDPLPVARLEQARAVLGLFPPDDVVWCGSFKDSIPADDLDCAPLRRLEQVRSCFRPCAEWLTSGELPGPRTVPSAFGAGEISRSKDAVRRRRMLVIEHDHLSIAEQGAVLRWLREKAGMRLRAVVFTGNKSIHGWFDIPPAPVLSELETVLTAMGYDPASFNPAQPYPLPGWPHPKTGRLGELLFLDRSRLSGAAEAAR